MFEQQSPSADPLGDRMKAYEYEMRSFIPDNSYAVIRLDGRAFHTWVRGLDRPYDVRLVDVMGETLQVLCEEIGGAVFGMTQSDEISILMTDTQRAETQQWFGGGVQKIVSIAASIATGHFARAYPDRPLAQFDARVTVLPSFVEVLNAMKWRQDDCEKNAIGMLCQANFSARELHGVSTAQRRQMLVDKGVDLDACDKRFMHGQACYRETVTEQVPYIDKRTGLEQLSPLVSRRKWKTIASPRLDATPDGWLAQQLAHIAEPVSS